MTAPQHVPDSIAVADYATQAREFLAQSREYLANDRLHQASEKGWGAAAHMVKAVAEAQGWVYQKHRDFSRVMNQASRLTGNDRLLDLQGRASLLHENYYERKRFLDANIIGKNLESMEELVELLAPLTIVERNGNIAGE